MSIDKYKLEFSEHQLFGDPIVSGVYFLFDGNELVYIGKSENVYSRVLAHHKDPKKIFTSWNYTKVECKEQMSDVEVGLILHHNPKYNLCVSGSKKYTSKPFKVSYRLGISVHIMKKAIARGVFKTYVFNGKVYYDSINIEREIEKFIGGEYE